MPTDAPAYLVCRWVGRWTAYHLYADCAALRQDHRPLRAVAEVQRGRLCRRCRMRRRREAGS